MKQIFKHLGKTAHDMQIDLIIGVPVPEVVDRDRVAGVLPYGSVSVTVKKGGLEIPTEEENDAIIIANASVIVHIVETDQDGV